MTAPIRSITTVKELREFFENLLDDSPDQDFVYQQLSIAKNRIEMENDLSCLWDEDTSQTARAGDDPSITHALPDTWRKTRYMRIGPGAGPLSSYSQVPFPRRFDRQMRRYFIDLKNKVFGFTGTVGMAGTIYHGFLRATDDFTEDTEDLLLDDVLAWPSEFAPIIAYEAAGFYQTGVDPDTVSTTQGAVNIGRANQLLDALISWDQDNKLSELDGRTGYAENADGEDDVFDVGALPG